MKQQGACGSCWAVAAAGALEIHAEIAMNPGVTTSKFFDMWKVRSMLSMSCSDMFSSPRKQHKKHSDKVVFHVCHCWNLSLHGVLKKLTRPVTLEVPRNVSFKQLVVTWQCRAVGCFQCAILDLVGFCPVLLNQLQQFQDCTPNPEHCGGDGGCEGATSELAFEYASKPLI